MKIKEWIWKLCGDRGHLWMPPWAKVRRCAICGKFESLEVGEKSIRITPGGADKLKWTGSGAAAAYGELGMDVSTGRPSVYTLHQPTSVAAEFDLVTEATEGYWENVYYNNITTATTSIDISDVSKDDDFIIVMARIKGTTGSSATYRLLPNALTTNQTSTYLRVINGSASHGTSARLTIGTATGIASYNTSTLIKVVIHPAYSIEDGAGPFTTYRSFFAVCGGAANNVSTATAFVSGGSWYATTALTSLRLESTTNMQPGTSVRAWVLTGQSNDT